MIEAWWVNRQLKWMLWIQPRLREVWTLGWKKLWLQTWMDWGEDHCSEASCGPSGCKIRLKQPDALAWKHLYRYTAGYHQHIDERTLRQSQFLSFCLQSMGKPSQNAQMSWFSLAVWLQSSNHDEFYVIPRTYGIIFEFCMQCWIELISVGYAR